MNVETHPFEPFLPQNARLLMLGTFPPSEKRWAMKFYYPNFTNDMWRIFGLCFFGDKTHFVLQDRKTYNLDAIIPFLQREGIAMYDTCTRIIRTKGTASDKDLQVVKETDLSAMLLRLPHCRAVLTAGQLATTIACRQFNIPEPKVGEYVEFHLPPSTIHHPPSTIHPPLSTLRLYRMPSSSRAYPMSIERKAAYYQTVFEYSRS